MISSAPSKNGDDEAEGAVNDEGEEGQEREEGDEGEVEKRTEVKEDEGFFEVEISVDEDLFDGDLSGITVGTFVSFRYTGEMHTFGPPKNPKVSFFPLFFPLYSLFFSLFCFSFMYFFHFFSLPNSP